MTGLSLASALQARQKLRQELVKVKSLSLMRKKEHSWYGLRPSGISELSLPWLTPASHVFNTIPESEKRQHVKDQMLLLFFQHKDSSVVLVKQNLQKVSFCIILEQE